MIASKIDFANTGLRDHELRTKFVPLRPACSIAIRPELVPCDVHEALCRIRQKTFRQSSQGVGHFVLFLGDSVIITLKLAWWYTFLLKGLSFAVLAT